jgi:hypothetical protein
MPKELGTYLVKLSDHITEKDHGILFNLAKVVFHEASMQADNFFNPFKKFSHAIFRIFRFLMDFELMTPEFC